MANKDYLLQLNHDLKVVNMFNSVDEAAGHLGICRSLIYGVLSGRNAWTHGFTFLWKSDYDNAMGPKVKEPEEEELPVKIQFKEPGMVLVIPSESIENIFIPEKLFKKS